jgi:DNA-directed RNA polymerase specialized sigma24 family protein
MRGYRPGMVKRTAATSRPPTVAAALAALSHADLLRLKRFAQLRSLRLPLLNWSDLLNEAIARALDGSRVWPADLDFLVFMLQSIRSIASEQWRRIRRTPITREADLPPADPDSTERACIDNIGRNELNPQREVLAERALRDVVAIFRADKQATAILEGLAEGHAPADIQRRGSMTPIQYASAQRRIRRALARAFPDGGELI